MNSLSSVFSYLNLSCIRTNAVIHSSIAPERTPSIPAPLIPPQITDVRLVLEQQTSRRTVYSLHKKTISILPQESEKTLEISKKNENSIRRKFCKHTYSDGVNIEGIIETGTFTNGELKEGTRTNERFGTTERGFFKNGRLILGSITNIDGTKSTGTFNEDGGLEGFGRIEFPNGGKCIGKFREGALNGLGWVIDSKGREEIGYFENSSLEGTGVITNKNQIIESGFYTNGERIAIYRHAIDPEKLRGRILGKEMEYLADFRKKIELDETL